MPKRLLAPLLLAVLSLALRAAAQSVAPAPVHAASGQVERWAAFPSRFVAARNVDVWLPAGYSPARRYNVIYMHDGQMLFDASTTWNGQAWQVDAAIARLVAAGRLPDTIVVGIWNNGPARFAEFMPQQALATMDAAALQDLDRASPGERPQADAYLRFLVQELKPAIDRRYATWPDRAHTFLMGSSMGGLISLYGLVEYPDVFGGAACLSTHWTGPGQNGNARFPLALLRFLEGRLPDPATHRLYMDHGTLGLDAYYGHAQALFDDVAREAGYGPASYRSVEVAGADHREVDWARRLDGPLLFLLEKR